MKACRNQPADKLNLYVNSLYFPICELTKVAYHEMHSSVTLASCEMTDSFVYPFALKSFDSAHNVRSLS